MWYRIAKDKKKEQPSKEELPTVDPKDPWFEIVPENLWLLRGTGYSVIKSSRLRNDRVPVTNYVARLDYEEIGQDDDLEKAKAIVDKAAAKD